MTNTRSTRSGSARSRDGSGNTRRSSNRENSLEKTTHRKSEHSGKLHKTLGKTCEYSYEQRGLRETHQKRGDGGTVFQSDGDGLSPSDPRHGKTKRPRSNLMHLQPQANPGMVWTNMRHRL